MAFNQTCPKCNRPKYQNGTGIGSAYPTCVCDNVTKETPMEETKVICNQCKNCAVENTAILGCADDNCKCHTVVSNKIVKTLQEDFALYAVLRRTIQENLLLIMVIIFTTQIRHGRKI